MIWQNVKKYLKPIGIALGVGILSALCTMKNMSVFDDIKSPALTPPAFVFPVVWTILFILMGISSGIIYMKRNANYDKSQTALRVYALNLAMNFLWSIIFFNMRAFFFAFVWIVGLWLVILWMIAEFYKIDELAAKLQIPYLIWVTFAAYLNLMIAVLN